MKVGTIQSTKPFPTQGPCKLVNLLECQHTWQNASWCCAHKTQEQCHNKSTVCLQTAESTANQRVQKSNESL